MSKRMIAIALLDSGGGSLNCVREKVLRDRIHGDASLQQDPIIFALHWVIFSAHLDKIIFVMHSYHIFFLQEDFAHTETSVLLI